MKIVFYDINLLNHKKYIGGIIKSLSEGVDNEVFVIYDEFNQEGEQFFSGIACHVLRNRAITYDSIQGWFKKIKPDLFVVNAQRLSDSAFVSVAQKMSVPTVMIQHGMYIPFMKRERFFLIRKVYKTIKYFLYSQVIAKSINQGGFSVFKKFYLVFIKGEPYKKTIDFANQINTDYVLTYGEYWSNYHFEQFGYDLEQQYVIGYHELKKIEGILEKEKEKNAICYIAQTLVEDGRIDKRVLIDFLTTLNRLSDKKIYIKLHPRSDLTLYQFSNFVCVREELPNVDTYVGHYSSLIALAACIGQDIILYEFANHEIPEYFKKMGTVSQTTLDFEAELKRGCSKAVGSKKDIEYYFSDSYDLESIISLLKDFSVIRK